MSARRTRGAFAKKVAAQDAAHASSAMLDVANDLEVRPPGAGRE